MGILTFGISVGFDGTPVFDVAANRKNNAFSSGVISSTRCSRLFFEDGIMAREVDVSDSSRCVDGIGSAALDAFLSKSILIGIDILLYWL